MEILNIEIQEKTDYTLTITYRDDLTNLPINITGYSAVMDIKPEFGSNMVYLSLTDSNGGLTLGGVTGNIDINVSANQVDPTIQAHIFDRGIYTLVLTDTFLKKIPLLKGFFTIVRI